MPPEPLGIASGLLSLTRTLGQTTGVPLLGAIFAGIVSVQSSSAMMTDAPAETLVFGVQNTFKLAAAVLVIAASVVFLLWRSQPHETV